MQVISVVLFLLLAPLAGGLLDGLDRIIAARMQGRKGPPLLQPFYDLAKLFSKQMIAVNSVQMLLNLSYLIFLAIAGSMLFAGADILMCLFMLSTADMFLVMAASSDSSPFSTRLVPGGGHYPPAGQRGCDDAGFPAGADVCYGHQTAQITV